MKKLFLCFISVCLIFTLCSCGKVTLDEQSTVKLIYNYDNISVDTQLSEQESKEILDIFDGKELFFDSPSCGFDKNISLRINEKIYCPACDTCCIVKDCSSGQYFSITQTERNTIEEIFNAYGGHFPCL